MLTITHTDEAGTLIDGTTRGDGTAPILKAHGWRWGRSIGAWYVPHSRDRLPKDHVITRTVAALEAAGYEVTTQLDRTPRGTAEVEADKAARQLERIVALEAKAERKDDAAAQAWARAEAAGDALPPMGEPIKIGHHSENRHRNALDRAHRRMGQAVAADAEAAEAARRAETATHTTGARYAPVTVANRIEKLSADIRRAERRIVEDWYDREQGYVCPTEEQVARRAELAAPLLERLRDQLAYWEQVRAEQIASGRATNYGPHNVTKGDAVKIRGNWWTVARVNTKTVSVETAYSWTDRSPWVEVQEHRPAGDPPPESSE
ncbi:DUF3560 domain-containing protein [Leucobacter sp. wl10]|uniref:DUF3560 domain-containing protein n=1 Tax=Leucobacter sp. wl10 TaxID=2304677 RepID=UPI000E5A573F|nr:DUF3560 domain-containing protein [Leucobacter sp. wl10]RGE19071.1 DUF3560 domain-containing protein [Leucobacter sp. wl10]